MEAGVSAPVDTVGAEGAWQEYAGAVAGSREFAADHAAFVAGYSAALRAQPVEHDALAELRSEVFAILRRHDVSEQCFAEVAMVTHAALSRQPVEAEGWRKALAEMVDAFGCSLELLERGGPSLTCADGEFIHSSVLSDRADIIERARTALEPRSKTDEG